MTCCMEAMSLVLQAVVLLLLQLLQQPGSVQCAVCSVHVEVCSVHSAVCSVQCAGCSERRAVCSVVPGRDWSTVSPDCEGFSTGPGSCTQQ